MPELRDNFQEVLRRYTAGDPMREEVTWTNLTKTEIAERLAKTSTPVSVNIVTQLLEDADFRRRKLRKTLAMGSAPRRKSPFGKAARPMSGGSFRLVGRFNRIAMENDRWIPRRQPAERED